MLRGFTKLNNVHFLSDRSFHSSSPPHIWEQCLSLTSAEVQPSTFMCSDMFCFEDIGQEIQRCISVGPEQCQPENEY